MAAVFAPAFEGLEGLEALRADIDNNIATSPTYNTSENEEFTEEMYNRYIAMIRPLFDATDQITRSVDDETLRTGAQLVNTTARHHRAVRRHGPHAPHRGRPSTAASTTATSGRGSRPPQGAAGSSTRVSLPRRNQHYGYRAIVDTQYADPNWPNSTRASPAWAGAGRLTGRAVAGRRSWSPTSPPSLHDQLGAS